MYLSTYKYIIIKGGNAKSGNIPNGNFTGEQ